MELKDTIVLLVFVKEAARFLSAQGGSSSELPAQCCWSCFYWPLWSWAQLRAQIMVKGEGGSCCDCAWGWGDHTAVSMGLGREGTWEERWSYRALKTRIRTRILRNTAHKLPFSQWLPFLKWAGNEEVKQSSPSDPLLSLRLYHFPSQVSAWPFLAQPRFTPGISGPGSLLNDTLIWCC